jgi:hypothetical protein
MNAPIPPPMVESDLEFFCRRPHVSTRTRLPFEGEFPPGVLAGRSAFVRILIERDADGQPKRRARRAVVPSDLHSASCEWLAGLGDLLHRGTEDHSSDQGECRHAWTPIAEAKTAAAAIFGKS